MSAQSLRFSLTEGIMRQQGSAVPREQFEQLIGYLAPPDTSGDWVAGMMCKPDQRAIDLNQPISMSMTGADARNSRRLTAQQAGLTSDDLRNLELAWAIAFPKVASLRTSAAVIGSTMFYAPAPTGKVLALDAHSACVKWAYDAEGPLRSSLSYGDIGGGRMALIFGDARGNVHTVDPKTGARIWKADARHESFGGITGAPVLTDNRIIVPISASGVGRGADPKYECCEGHGDVVALDAKALAPLRSRIDRTSTGSRDVDALGLAAPVGGGAGVPGTRHVRQTHVELARGRTAERAHARADTTRRVAEDEVARPAKRLSATLDQQRFVARKVLGHLDHVDLALDATEERIERVRGQIV
jgi:polyvinyl alcohol dehydrogenase (cytochrome)